MSTQPVSRVEGSLPEFKIGDYYESLVHMKTEFYEDDPDHTLKPGDLVVIVELNEGSGKLGYRRGEVQWTTTMESFADRFRFAPDGLQRRMRDMMTLHAENVAADVDPAKLQEGLLAFNPHVEPTVEPSAEENVGEEDGTGLVPTAMQRARQVTDASRQNLAGFQGDIRKFTHAMERRTKAIAAIMSEQTAVVAAKAEELERLANLANGAVAAMDVYLGVGEERHRVKKGRPAPADEKIVIRQLVLAMDEESAIAADKGGMDFQQVGEFLKWIKNPAHLQQVLPEQKGIVALRPRRHNKSYGDPWTEMRAEKANARTYWLLRNGENVWVVTNTLNVGFHIIPLLNEYDQIFTRDDPSSSFRSRAAKKPIRPGDDEWMDAMRKADDRKRHYMKILLFLQHLLDHTVVFLPKPEGGINLMSERLHEKWVHYVYDAEPSRLLPTGRPSYTAWMADLMARLDVGMRVIRGYHSDYYDDCDPKYQRVRPVNGPHPKRDQIYTIEKRENEKTLVFYFERGDVVRRGGWGGSYGPAKNRASYRVFKSDKHILNFDLATVYDMRFYLSDRVNRHEYASMFPTLQLAIKMKEQEAKEERPFIRMMVGALMRDFGVGKAEAEAAVDDLVDWWKFKNRTHRALKKDDKLATRMILDEYGQRKEKDKIRATLDHDAVLKAILARHPDAVYIGHKTDYDYVAIVPHNEYDYFVREQTWRARDAAEPAVVLTEDRQWRGVDNRYRRWMEVYSTERWAKWPKNLRVETIPTDPELQEIVRQALEQLPEIYADDKQVDEPIALALSLSEDQHVSLWVQRRKFVVPRRYLTSRLQKMGEYGIIGIGWERGENGAVNITIGRRSTYSFSQKKKPWERDWYDAKVRTLWVNQKAVAAIFADVERVKRFLREQRPYTLTDWKIDREIRQKALEVVKERAWVAFKAEHGDDRELFEADNKNTKWGELVPYKTLNRLQEPVAYLVERDVDLTGWTLRKVGEQARAYGWKGEFPEDPIVPLDFEIPDGSPEPTDMADDVEFDDDRFGGYF
jgi:hypothetical protein